MKLMFHWQGEEEGMILHERSSVAVNLLDGAGEIPSADPRFTIEGEYQPSLPLWPWPRAGKRSFSGSFNAAGRAALTLEGLTPPNANPGRIEWRLLSDGLLVEQGNSLW